MAYMERRRTMPNIETYYLVDFENVNDAGLACSNQLGNHDHILIFSTKNAPKISIESLSTFNSIDFSSYNIPVGKQSVDMHLIAYLGYLVGKNSSKKCRYIIVSKDSDYDNIISFFKDFSSSEITRQANIDSSPQKTTPTSAKAKPVTCKNAASSSKTQLNTEIQRSISNAGYDETISNTVASIVSKHYGSERFSNNVHNELRTTYTNYIEIYNIIKPIIKKYATDTLLQASSTSQLNTEIQKTLSKASFDNKIITHVASLICKHHNDANAKQVIYRMLVSEYGAGTGLNIYNHIKKII